MATLSECKAGSIVTIEKIETDKVCLKYLNSLGILRSGEVHVLQNYRGNLILRINDSRVVINSDMAKKIYCTDIK